MGRPKCHYFNHIMDQLEQWTRDWCKTHGVFPRPRDVLHSANLGLTKVGCNYWLRQLRESERIDDLLQRYPLSPRGIRQTEAITQPTTPRPKAKTGRTEAKCTREMAEKIVALLLEIA